jgi:hypothetical protein
MNETDGTPSENISGTKGVRVILFIEYKMTLTPLTLSSSLSGERVGADNFAIRAIKAASSSRNAGSVSRIAGRSAAWPASSSNAAFCDRPFAPVGQAAFQGVLLRGEGAQRSLVRFFFERRENGDCVPAEHFQQFQFQRSLRAAGADDFRNHDDDSSDGVKRRTIPAYSIARFLKLTL